MASIERMKVGGREAWVAYLKDWQPVEKSEATLIKVHYLDNHEIKFFVPAEKQAEAQKVVKFNSHHDEHGRFTFGRSGAVPAESLAAKVAAEGGFTVHPSNGVAPKDGWMVSLKNYEVAVPKDQFTKETIEQYLATHGRALKRDGNFLGAWFNKDDGKVYLDVSTRVPSKDKAIQLAKRREQFGIFNMKTKEYVATNAHKAQEAEMAKSPATWHVAILDTLDVDAAFAAVQQMVEAASSKPGK